MPVQKMIIKNYKRFMKTILYFHSLNVIIDDLDAGKSAIIDIFKLIRDNNIKQSIVEIQPNTSGIAVFDFNITNTRLSLDNKNNILEEDGSNLHNVLCSIIHDKPLYDTVSNLLSFMIPDYKHNDNIIAENEQKILIADIYNKTKYIPLQEASDSIISILLVILALYTVPCDTIVIKDIDRHMPPVVVNRLAHLLKDASELKQIIATTDNPELVGNVPENTVLFLCCDNKGRTYAYRPANTTAYKTFRKNNMKVDDLYVGGLLKILL